MNDWNLSTIGHDDIQPPRRLPTPTPRDSPPVAPKQRRPHRKTKTGCVDCRKRHVKCDEQKPACASCTRRGVTCEYTVQRRLDAGADCNFGTTSTSCSPNSTPSWPRLSRESLLSRREALVKLLKASNTCPGPSVGVSDRWDPSATLPLELASTSTFGMGHMALLHHWILSTSTSICREPTFTHYWQCVFPEIGFKYPFVMHAILSLATLHYAHINGASNVANEAGAAEHHNHSLRGFYQSVADITEDNSEALFVWSLLNMIYVFGRSTNSNVVIEGVTTPGASHKDLMLGVEWIPMIRGIDAILGPTHNYLRFGRMQEIMDVGNWFSLQPGPVERDQFDCHLCMTREIWKDNKETDEYDTVVEVLRKCRMFILQFEAMDAHALTGWGYNRSWSGPFMFIHFAPQAYFTHLYQRQPPALVLFAYFGALLHGLNEYWFIEGWGRSIVTVVDDVLGSYWRRWIALPLELVGLS